MDDGMGPWGIKKGCAPVLFCFVLLRFVWSCLVFCFMYMGALGLFQVPAASNVLDFLCIDQSRQYINARISLSSSPSVWREQPTAIRDTAQHVL
jgi:hypothetical protein